MKSNKIVFFASIIVASAIVFLYKIRGNEPQLRKNDINTRPIALSLPLNEAQILFYSGDSLPQSNFVSESGISKINIPQNLSPKNLPETNLLLAMNLFNNRHSDYDSIETVTLNEAMTSSGSGSSSINGGGSANSSGSSSIGVSSSSSPQQGNSADSTTATSSSETVKGDSSETSNSQNQNNESFETYNSPNPSQEFDGSQEVNPSDTNEENPESPNPNNPDESNGGGFDNEEVPSNPSDPPNNPNDPIPPNSEQGETSTSETTIVPLPRHGPVGTAVTLTLVGKKSFNQVQKVYFEKTEASFKVVSQKTILTYVPPYADGGVIKVVSKGNEVTRSKLNFFVTIPLYYENPIVGTPFYYTVPYQNGFPPIHPIPPNCYILPKGGPTTYKLIRAGFSYLVIPAETPTPEGIVLGYVFKNINIQQTELAGLVYYHPHLNCYVFY